MRRLLRTLGLALVAALLTAGPAQADFGVTDFSFSFTNEDGSPATQAGSHPFAQTLTFGLETKEEVGKVRPDGNLKDIRFAFPAGFIGSTAAVPRCASADFLAVDKFGYPGCPDATAIGAIQVQALNFGQHYNAPVYNLVPPPGVPAKIGFIAYSVPATVDAGLNPEAPNNLVAAALNAPQATEIYGVSSQLWGVPAAHSHDAFRGRCLQTGFVVQIGEFFSNGNCDTGAAEVPFLTLPRSCTGPLTASYEAVSWQAPGAAPVKGTDEVPGMTGCSKLGFGPEVSVRPTTTSAESASGLDFAIDIDNEGVENPTGLSQSDVKDLVVRMPAGMTINPSSANGLAACSRAAFEAESLSSRPGEGCPEAAKIGDIEVETPILPDGEVLHGDAFVASQDDNPFGTLAALYVVIRDTRLGVLVKQAVKVEPNEEQGPDAGQVVTFAEDLPQVPFSHLRFHFKEGPRAPLVTPPSCGSYTTQVRLSPWAEPANPLAVGSPFAINSGIGGGPCPSGVPPFHPTFSAGSLNNAAGAYSPFAMRLTRADGEQEITRLDAVLPKGLTAKLAGVARCPGSAVAAAKAKSGRAELATPSCPAASLIGHTTAGAGVGPTLTYVPGNLYLAGPFAGAPLSVIAITPVVAGPFDVGTVVVHAALQVDPETAEVTVDGSRADPFPHLLKGIPTKLRDLRVDVDRPDFALNPTSCAKKSAKAGLWGSYLNVFSSADDVAVSLSARYQAASCASLKFKPNLALSLKGGVKRGAHPALKGVLTYPRGSGYANVAKAIVTLPHSAFLDQAHIRTVCTRVQFRAEQCPPGSIYGKARAISPLFDEPLEGPVYLRSSNHPLPDLVVALHGLVDVNLVGRVDSVDASIRTSFESAPDAPVSKFVLEMKGGKKGLIVNSRNLCARKSRASAAFTAQSGKVLEQTPVVKASCGK